MKCLKLFCFFPELFSYRLPPVPEEAIADDTLLRSLPATSASYPDLSKSAPTSSTLSLMSQIEQSSQSMVGVLNFAVCHILFEPLK